MRRCLRHPTFSRLSTPLPVSYTHLRAHETDSYLVCRLLLEKKWRQKTRVPGLSYGIVCVKRRLAVLVEHRLVTDTQTDRQTDRRTHDHGM